MSSRLPTIFDDLFPDSAPEFRAISEAWPPDVVKQILSLVWDGFDRLKALPNYQQLDFTKDYAQLERSLTDLHMDEITSLWGQNASRFESFIPKHEPWEFEGLTNRSARPPSCDLGFVWLSNRRIRWSVEAKVLQSSKAIAEYLTDISKFLDGKSAPFSTQGAIAGYLVSGEPDDFFTALAKKLKCAITPSCDFPARPHGCTNHKRSKTNLADGMPLNFICHHLVCSLN